MKDQRGIPHREQMRIHSIFRGSAATESSVSQISITPKRVAKYFS